ISLPGHDLMMALKTPNVLLTLDLGGKEQLALPKDVQRDPIKGFLEHVDLLVVKKGEKVTVEIPVHVVGEAAPETLVVTEHSTVTVEAEATHIPEYIEVDIEGAEVGTQVFARDLQVPQGSTLHLDDDTLVVNVTHAPTAEEVEAELEGAEAEAGIEREESEASAEGEGESGEGESEESAGE
ncbi:MAG: 50S ribosomal protein L25/general stress protein Ctc, partial [Nocardioidaceae bacterium]